MATDNIHNLPGAEETRKQWEALKSGGGDGTFGGMEARVAKLEASMEHALQDVSELRADTKDIRERLRAVEVKVDHLPSKGFIVVALLGALAVITGLIGYSSEVQDLFQPSINQ